MGEYLKNINWKHVLIMCIGNVLQVWGLEFSSWLGLEQIRSVV